MLFLLNIGNTHAQPGIWNGKTLELLPRIPTAELRPDQLPADLPVAAATVVPETRRMLDRENLYWLTPQIHDTGKTHAIHHTAVPYPA